MADNTIFLYNFSLKPGQCVELDGFIPEGCRRFFINLGKDAKNLVIHFDVRFDFQAEKRILSLNSMEDGVWGEELREKVFPFKEASDTMVCFQYELDKITIQLSSGKPFSFPVRFTMEEISYMAEPICPYPGSVKWP
ncbi:unnamed protein product [Staurois parvus]|uniref:Galectin n=1 Tax=Staurois parvus TaxID=386267 RepID=A0ABN9FNH6_9NEOB|nr:unnamed protein product [Staurois parvus]